MSIPFYLNINLVKTTNFYKASLKIKGKKSPASAEIVKYENLINSFNEEILREFSKLEIINQNRAKMV